MDNKKVVNLNARQHIYDIDNCAGCKKAIGEDEEYREIGLPQNFNTEIKHIALCKKCSDVAKGYGVID